MKSGAPTQAAGITHVEVFGMTGGCNSPKHPPTQEKPASQTG